MKSKEVNVSKQYKIRQHRPNLEETLQAKFDDTDDDNVD
jgi:hypothetical protein